MNRFPYADRAAVVNAANIALNEASNRRFVPGANGPESLTDWHEAVEYFRVARASAFPEDFWPTVERLGARDPLGVSVAVEFLEADPVFSGSGYLKARLARLLQHVELSDNQAQRLKGVILNVVRQRNTYEFRQYCRLAYRLHDELLCEELKCLASSPELQEARRANWMLTAIRAHRFQRLRQFASQHKF